MADFKRRRWMSLSWSNERRRDGPVHSMRWAGLIERWHRTILLASLVLAVLSALSLLRLRFDFDVLDMLPAGAPAFDDFKTFVAEFGGLDRLVVMIEGPNAEKVRRVADAFVERVRRLDTVEHVQGKVDMSAIEQGLLGRALFNYLPQEGYAQLRERLTPSGIEAQVSIDHALLQAPFDLQMVERVRRDPLGILPLAAASLPAAFGESGMNLADGYIASRDGRAVLVLIRPTHGAFDIPFTTRLMEQIEAAAGAAQAAAAAPGVRIVWTGSYAFALEDAATIRGDIARYSLLTLVGVLAIFYVAYRDLRILPYVTYPLVLSTLLTFAVSVLFYSRLNAISLSCAGILYGLSLDSGVHYFTRFSQEHQRYGVREAIARTLADLGGANIVASVTTAVVFWLIGFSALKGVSQLGSLTGLGMVINIAQFFVLYPALSYWMPRPSIAATPLDTNGLGRLAASCETHARSLTWTTLALTVMLAVAAGGVTFDVDLTHLRPARSDAARVEGELTSRFGASDTDGAILVSTPTLEEALQRSETIEAQLRAYRDEKLVTSLRGITTLLPSERTQRERLALYAQLPRQKAVQELREALQRRGFRVERFDDFFADFARPRTEIVAWPDPILEPFAPLIDQHLRRRDGRFTVATYLQPADGVHLATVADRLHAAVPDASFIVAARSLLQEELGRVLRGELVWFFFAAFALNLILVLMSVRHLGTAIAVLVPQAVVIVVCLGLMQLTGGVGPVNIIVVPLILGIGVDHCVYLAERWQHGESIDDAVRHGGRAIAVSGLTTAAGFGLLGLSRYPALANMGLLAAASLTLCLLAAVTLFPALLVLLGPAGRKEIQVSPPA